MANTAAVITDVTKETMRLFENNLVFTSKVNRQFDEYFGKSGRKIGQTLTVRIPPKFTIRSGATFAAQDITDQTSVITQATQEGIDFAFTSAELTQSFDMVSERYIAPMVRTLTANIDKTGMAQYLNVYNMAGTAGTSPATMTPVLAARAKILNQAGPESDLHGVVDITGNNSLIVGNSALFANNSKISDQYDKGMFGKNVFGLDDLSFSQSVNFHTAGLQGGTPLSNGATQTGASIATDGWSNSITGVVKAGDVLTFAGVYSVNPLTKISTGILQDFVVTADANSNGSGQATILISPPVTTSTAYQTVSTSIADNSAIVVKTGTTGQITPQSLIFNRDAFTFVMADLELPTSGVEAASRKRYKDYSVRVITFYDGSTDQFKFRLDVLYGWKTLRPEWACRLIG